MLIDQLNEIVGVSDENIWINNSRNVYAVCDQHILSTIIECVVTSLNYLFRATFQINGQLKREIDSRININEKLYVYIALYTHQNG